MTRDARSQASLDAVKAMEAGLAANEMDMTQYFTEGFKWRGNQGCGTKNGVKEFQRNWQWPL
ncbi:MAG: polyketide cyclase, partial [Yoonia sp.]